MFSSSSSSKKGIFIMRGLGKGRDSTKTRKYGGDKKAVAEPVAEHTK